MDEVFLQRILSKVSDGDLSIDAALAELRYLPYRDLGFAKIDHHRELRSGLAETVYGPGKTPEQIKAIVAELIDRSAGAVLVTRADEDQFRAALEVAPEARWDETSRVIVAKPNQKEPSGIVLIASAGTSDLPVAEEAAVTAEALGLKVERLRDVGVAGVHRVLGHQESLRAADALIVVAGMDGALASLIGGLVAAPVIAVPTSVGYGAGAGGIAPLLTMLNSCAPGVAVVNIDNGFGAAVFAATVLRVRE
ncbi:MAG: nickel pincer cofactor biosynthesis protein LarB [Actinobacteria bacterium]|nr:nickel pincer cofactor biosynthesis protein LarB [Actinomycetota bacterium]